MPVHRCSIKAIRVGHPIIIFSHLVQQKREKKNAQENEEVKITSFQKTLYPRIRESVLLLIEILIFSHCINNMLIRLSRKIFLSSLVHSFSFSFLSICTSLDSLSVTPPNRSHIHTHTLEKERTGQRTSLTVLSSYVQY